MGGRAQSGWKVSYLCKSIKHDLLSSSSICNAVVQQVCSLQGHKSTHIDTFLPSRQFPFCKSTIFALFRRWSEGSGWCRAVANCGGALAETTSSSTMLWKSPREYPARGILPTPRTTPTKRTRHSGACHRHPLLPVCRSHGLPQAQLWLLYSAVLCGRQALFQNAFLTQTSRLSRHAILLFSILRIFFFGGSVAVQQSPESDLYKRLGKGKNYSFLLCPLQCLCDL